jgi:L-ascorbate metabolism protein UlaG (beta-lactamase superfamily)
VRVRLIRHATLVVDIGGRRLLIDPMLDDAGARPPIAHTANDRRNPLLPLPMPIEEILEGIDAVLVTHLHADHLDEAAIRALPPSLPLFCQPQDLEVLREHGFTGVTPVQESAALDGITVHRTPARHGRGEIGEKMAPASGFVIEADGEPSVYVAGDTIWCDEVAETLRTHTPDITVVNAGAAQFVQGGPITMDADGVIATARAEPRTQVVAVHIEAINHCLLTREALRVALEEAGLHDVAVPDDGESVALRG